MDLRVHYHVQSNLPLTPVLSQINPTTYHPVSLRSTSVVSYLCLPRLSKWSLSFKFTHQNHVHIYLLSTLYHVPCQSHLLDLIIQITYVEDRSLLNLSVCNFLLRSETSNFLLQNIFLSSLFWNTYIP